MLAGELLFRKKLHNLQQKLTIEFFFNKHSVKKKKKKILLQIFSSELFEFFLKSFV